MNIYMEQFGSQNKNFIFTSNAFSDIRGKIYFKYFVYSKSNKIIRLLHHYNFFDVFKGEHLF